MNRFGGLFTAWSLWKLDDINPKWITEYTSEKEKARSPRLVIFGGNVHSQETISFLHWYSTFKNPKREINGFLGLIRLNLCNLKFTREDNQSDTTGNLNRETWYPVLRIYLTQHMLNTGCVATWRYVIEYENCPLSNWYTVPEITRRIQVIQK